MAPRPAYDVTYAENDAWTRQHQMSVNGKFQAISRRDLLEVGEMFDVPKGGGRSSNRWRGGGGLAAACPPGKRAM